MLPRDWKGRIQDILDAIAEIQSFTRGMDYEAFSNDARTIKAVELDLIVIGEAANQIPDNLEESFAEVPWASMRAMRNRLVHVYFSVDTHLLWDTVQNDLPPLIPLLEKVLR